jgi:radical SAM superfamily enzyme YgiQ (UPF0313 family)
MAVRGKRMKILLVQPTTIHLDGTPLKSKRRFIMGLMMPLMAGLTPPDVEVEVCDERLEDPHYDGGYDLVGMTTTIGSALRAYQLAHRFRRRKVPVVMGGFHATLNADETLQHADAVVVGEAELEWEQVLQDAADGKLKPIYKADKLHDLKALPRPRHELLKLNRYLFKAVPIQATRGCPYHCSFCEIPVFYNTTFRMRPVDDIVKEIRDVIQITGMRNFQFIDDQIAGKHEFAKELFRAIAPLRIKFSCLWTINTNQDHELLDLAAKAGAYHVNIGIESISPGSLRSIGKVQNHAEEYKELLARLRGYGIFYSLNFLFGLDDDQPGIFEDTMRFLDEVKAPVAFFNAVTPRRGTPMRTQLEEEGRVIIPDADMYTNNHRCMFVPKNLTPQQVEEGVWWCTDRFYSLRSILKRLLWPPNAYTGQGIPSNLYFYWGAKRRIDPVDYY